MTYSDLQLRYDSVLHDCFGALLTGRANADAWIHRDAQDLHSRMVADAVLEVAVSAIVLSDSPLNREAVFHLRFGVARRAKSIWGCLRRLLIYSPPGLLEPISLEDVEIVANDLNSIYINIRGLLDNMAWTVKAQHPSERISSLKDQQVDLFGSAFEKALGVEAFRNVLAPSRPWYTDVKKRRDPAAHRIPLTVPPAFLDEAAEREYDKLSARHEAMKQEAYAVIDRRLEAHPQGHLTLAEADEISSLFDKAGEMHKERQDVGRYPGMFAHHPDEPPIFIYPTVAEDVRELVLISRSLIAFLQAARV